MGPLSGKIVSMAGLSRRLFPLDFRTKAAWGPGALPVIVMGVLQGRRRVDTGPARYLLVGPLRTRLWSVGLGDATSPLTSVYGEEQFASLYLLLRYKIFMYIYDICVNARVAGIRV